jgi:hypothetical protein
MKEKNWKTKMINMACDSYCKVCQYRDEEYSCTQDDCEHIRSLINYLIS